jgi:hypothetical protein
LRRCDDYEFSEDIRVRLDLNLDHEEGLESLSVLNLETTETKTIIGSGKGMNFTSSSTARRKQHL